MSSPDLLPAPLVSVVVPTLASGAALRRCLEGLRTQSLGAFETLVVSNGGGEATRSLVHERFPEVRLLELERNAGFGVAVNAGAAIARGAYLALLNDDAEPRPGWLEELVACAERHPHAGSVTPKILRRDDPSVLDGAGDCLTRSLKAYRRGLGERDRGQYEREEQVFAASGTACLWRTDVFRELGGFDESFFAYYEDVDLGFRARLAGHECWYAPRAVVLHEGGATSRASWAAFESFHSVRNRWLMVAKDAPRPWILRNLHWIAAGEALTLARTLARRQLRLALRAYADVVRCRESVRAERERVQRGATVGYPQLRSLAPRRQPPAAMSWWRLRRSSGIGSAGISAEGDVPAGRYRADGRRDPT